MTTTKPHNEWREIGLPWLARVPAHWEVQRGKTLFDAIDVRSKTGAEELLTVSANHGVIPRNSANVTMFQAETYDGYKLCWPDDLVINSLWAWSKGLAVSNYHGIISSAYGVYRTRNRLQYHPRFVNYLARSTPFQWELQIRSKGIWISRLQLTDEAFLAIPFPVPPPEEQAAIVRYLDNTDQQIQRYIAGKERLIALLEEERQALVHQAVTRGLDPSVRLKPSGVEWLGDVPEHWVTCRESKTSSYSAEFGEENPQRSATVYQGRDRLYDEAISIHSNGASGVTRQSSSLDTPDPKDEELSSLSRRSKMYVLRNTGDVHWKRLHIARVASFGKVTSMHAAHRLETRYHHSQST